MYMMILISYYIYIHFSLHTWSKLLKFDFLKKSRHYIVEQREYLISVVIQNY
jgi:hypothetical protein